MSSMARSMAASVGTATVGAAVVDVAVVEAAVVGAAVVGAFSAGARPRAPSLEAIWPSLLAACACSFVALTTVLFRIFGRRGQSVMAGSWGPLQLAQACASWHSELMSVCVFPQVRHLDRPVWSRVL